MKGQNRPAVSLFALLAIMILTSALLCGCYQNNSQNTAQTPIGDSANGQKVEETGITDPLTGRKAQKVVPLVAVMVDNLGAARPQTGLGEAGVVYEMEAEAKITRFMALFAGDPPNAVGPVRSARSYYLQICKEWDALYAHVGGSKDASANIKSWGIKDLDEFRNGGEYRRDQARKAPHNVYLNIDKATKGKKQGLQPHWQFGNPAEGDPDFSKISFSYGSGNNVFYEFSASEKRYLRYINSSPHSDRDGSNQAISGEISKIRWIRRSVPLIHLIHSDDQTQRSSPFLSLFLGNYKRREMRQECRIYKQNGLSTEGVGRDEEKMEHT